MADIVTGTVTGQLDTSVLARDHADIRREQSVDACTINGNVKESGWNTINRVESNADRLSDQGTAYYIANQNVNFQNATALAALTATTNAGFVATQAAIQLEAAKNATAAALAQAQLMQTVVADGNATRALINTQTVDELRNQLMASKLDCCCNKMGHGGHDGRRGDRDGSFNFGPPLGARVPFET